MTLILAALALVGVVAFGAWLESRRDQDEFKDDNDTGMR